MVSPRFIPNSEEAAKVLFHFVVENPDEFPEDVRAQILTLLEPGKSPSFAVSEGAEIIYARRGEMSEKALLLGAELAITASNLRINNFADDDGRRGRNIAEALRKASGEKAPAGISWISKDELPEPKNVYLPPVGSDETDAPAPEPSARSVG